MVVDVFSFVVGLLAFSGTLVNKVTTVAFEYKDAGSQIKDAQERVYLIDDYIQHLERLPNDLCRDYAQYRQQLSDCKSSLSALLRKPGSHFRWLLTKRVRYLRKEAEIQKKQIDLILKFSFDILALVQQREDESGGKTACMQVACPTCAATKALVAERKKPVVLCACNPQSVLEGAELPLLTGSLVSKDSSIVQACLARDKERLHYIFNSVEGADPNARTPEGFPLLSYAIGGGSYEVVEFIISRDADVNVCFGPRADSLLIIAFFSGRPDLAQLLLENGAEINYTNALDWSCLCYLWHPLYSTETSIRLLEICKIYGFSHWNQPDGHGYTVLHRAAAHATPAEIKALIGILQSLHLTTEVYVGGLLWTPIHCAVAWNNEAAFDFFSSQTPPSEHAYFHDSRGFNLLHLAAESGAAGIALKLLYMGASLHEKTNGGSKFVPDSMKGKASTPREVAIASGTEKQRAFDDMLAKFESATLDLITNSSTVLDLANA